jgi:hypothetical protein
VQGLYVHLCPSAQQICWLADAMGVVCACVQGGLGSRKYVEPIHCMMACEMTEGCDSFSYNPWQRKCFLKAKPSTTVCQARFRV